MPQNGSLSGGRKLRMIRERQKLNQFEFDLSGVVTQANLSRIETGRMFPSRDKLEAILDLLQASFNERQEVMKAFGYLPPYPIPDEEEIQAACARCQPILDQVEMPAYLMDFLTRLLAWNDCFIRLLGDLAPDDVLNSLHYEPLFKSQFKSRVRMAAYMDDLEPYLLAEMQAIRERLAPYRGERWYDGFIAGLCTDRDFDHYWHKAADTDLKEEQGTDISDQVVQPVNFTLPGSDTELHFHANLDAVIGDDRFQLVYLIPADAFTLRQVERWVDEEP